MSIKTKIISASVVALAFSIMAHVGYATCTAMPASCDQLGYSATECASGTDFLKCPFDTSKVKCLSSGIESCAYTNPQKPDNCLVADSCTDGNTTYYSEECSVCNLEYNLVNGVCEALQPQGSLSFVVYSGTNQSITLKIAGTAIINWGDGNIETYESPYQDWTSAKSHTYSHYGNYTVVITGTPTKIESDQNGINNNSTSIYVTQLIDINLPGVQSYSHLFMSQKHMIGNLSTMTFPSTLTDGNNMFYGCEKLVGRIPTLPSGLTNGQQMFYGCAKLAEFGFTAFPSGLTDGSSMFSGCSSLTGNIPTLPSGLTNGFNMFNGCSRLSGFGFTAFPSGLTNGWNMFKGCWGLTGSIPTLPSGLTKGTNMFYNCWGLTGSVPALPSSLTDGQTMFYGCSGLTGFGFTAFPSGLTSGVEMFSGCSNLSGQCPAKSSSMNQYNTTRMYYSTNVTCDYGME